MVSINVLCNVQSMSDIRLVISIALSLHNIHCSRRPVDMFTSSTCVHTLCCLSVGSYEDSTGVACDRSLVAAQATFAKRLSAFRYISQCNGFASIRSSYQFQDAVVRAPCWFVASAMDEEIGR